MYTAGGEDYLNQKESIEVTGVAFATFKSLVKRLGVPTYTFPTKPKEIFYKKADLEKIMNTPQPAQTDK